MVVEEEDLKPNAESWNSTELTPKNALDSSTLGCQEEEGLDTETWKDVESWSGSLLQRPWKVKTQETSSARGREGQVKMLTRGTFHQATEETYLQDVHTMTVHSPKHESQDVCSLTR